MIAPAEIQLERRSVTDKDNDQRFSDWSFLGDSDSDSDYAFGIIK